MRQGREREGNQMGRTPKKNRVNRFLHASLSDGVSANHDTPMTPWDRVDIRARRGYCTISLMPGHPARVILHAHAREQDIT